MRTVALHQSRFVRDCAQFRSHAPSVSVIASNNIFAEDVFHITCVRDVILAFLTTEVQSHYSTLYVFEYARSCELHEVSVQRFVFAMTASELAP